MGTSDPAMADLAPSAFHQVLTTVQFVRSGGTPGLTKKQVREKLQQLRAVSDSTRVNAESVPSLVIAVVLSHQRVLGIPWLVHVA
eukprot:CAMPEP_0179102460 /NCGR_PEP_ID=MMETSP0796-20121207/47424_1 /TAXON_ID=73915 /ORGANISM="Pyrodinium bahamense, Strain pbaha01" /LENGTH=84 /DNA_ID=CAMNT_0020800337 /DNA_START=58 /DNA_END=313 /DNA_ORIENTATION=-